MKIIQAGWFTCTCGAWVTESEQPARPDEFAEVVLTEVVITPPFDGPQVDTEYPHIH